MANSVVYSSIFGAVMASLPAVATRLVVFDTAVVDLTDKLSDPVDVLFGVQLGGGTDINRAVGYCQGLISEPRNAIVVLISDLYEGGVESGLLRRASELVESGVQFITLLALSDEGAPPTTRNWPPSWPRWACPRSPARRTPSRSSWPPPSAATTWRPGRQGRASRQASSGWPLRPVARPAAGPLLHGQDMPVPHDGAQAARPQQFTGETRWLVLVC